MNDELDKIIFDIYLEDLFKYFKEADEELFIVGGYIRNVILNEPAHDIDLCTSASPDKMYKILENMHADNVNVKIIPTGIRYGTLTFYFPEDNKSYEITTYRKETEYQDYRHPQEIKLETRVENDLRRRDFTCNSIAWSPYTGFVDLFGGIYDLSHKILRCVGDPESRFKEDALRILRLVRFSIKYLLNIECETYIAALTYSSYIEKLSKERIGKELIEIFSFDLTNSKIPQPTLVLLEDILCCIDPENIARIENITSVIKQKTMLNCWYELCVHANCKSVLDVRRFLNQFALGPEIVNSVVKIYLAINSLLHSKQPIRALGYITEDEIDSFLEKVPSKKLKRTLCKAWRKHLPCKISDLEIDGDTICTLFNISPGIQVGKILDTCLSYVIDNPSKNKNEHLIKFIQTLLTSIQENLL